MMMINIIQKTRNQIVLTHVTIIRAHFISQYRSASVIPEKVDMLVTNLAMFCVLETSSTIPSLVM